jgi:hypothetical protein
LGFYVYRISGDSTERLNTKLVLGTYFQGNQHVSDSKYSYYDADGDSGSVYYIQSLGMNGRVVNSEMISPQTVEDLTAVAGVSSAELSKAAKSADAALLKSETELPADLKSEVAENAPESDAVMQRWVASQPGAKIGIKKEGFYRVSRADLQAAGFDVNSSPALWQLYVNGVQQSINVGADGSFVEFYGRGIDTLYSDQQIYYLLVGAQNGKRIGATAHRSVGGQNLSRSFAQSLTKKERIYYLSELLNGDAENFFGTIISQPTNINFNLPAVDFNVANASIDVGIQGANGTSHQVKVVLNGENVGVVSGFFYNTKTQRFNIPTSFLRSGVNTLQLTPMNGASDVSFFESVKVNYARRYQAEQNQLSFYTTNYRANYVEGFSSPNIRIFDVTYQNSPTAVTNLTAEQNDGGYRVYLPSNRGRVMYAVEDSAILAADSVTRNTPSALSTTAHNADLVIITHKDFTMQANDWANYRRSSGMSVEVVDVEDVYDEFNFGVVNSLSIRSFLQYAKTNWQTAPRYVLLIGDSTYDPRNYTRVAGNFNYVPTKQVDTGYGEAASDDTLADFNDDGLAEIPIGRSPARNSNEVTQLLNKTKTFELTSEQGLNRGMIFASDLPIGWDFTATSNRLRDLLPAGTPGVMVNRSDTDAKSRLINEINTGRFFINYAGHGSTGVWATNSFFGKADAAVLTNGSNLSVFTMLTCFNGFFTQPSVASDGLAETLLKAPNGGAVAAWASTGETTPDVQEIMATRFYRQLSLGNMKRLGDLINDSKTVINAGRDVRLSWVLLGDPTLKVR